MGHRSAIYVASLAHMGQPCLLPHSSSHVLVRPIPGTPWQDACAPYPLWEAQDFSQLSQDLHRLAPDWVSLVGVVSPFVATDLQTHFPDLCREYKPHWCLNLHMPLQPSKHHRRNRDKALAHLQVNEIDVWTPARVQTWQELYAQLCLRHTITGPAAFPPSSLATQLQTPGLRAWQATRDSEVVGITLWITSGNYVYYHLGAFNHTGYHYGAAFALFAQALATFQTEGYHEVDFGAGAGTWDSSAGLTRFKRGWATHTRPSWLCGRILQPERYQHLCPAPTHFFPGYRQP